MATLWCKLMSQILHCGDAANDLQSVEQSHGVLLPTMNLTLVGKQDAAVAASGNRIRRRTVYRAFRGGIFANPRRRVVHMCYHRCQDVHSDAFQHNCFHGGLVRNMRASCFCERTNANLSTQLTTSSDVHLHSAFRCSAWCWHAWP